jgi:pyruvate dehydrogenase E1 component alpha subunit
MERDPAPTFRRWLTAERLVTAERLDELDAEAAEYVDDAFTYAEAAPPPGPEELIKDVFADDTWVKGLA